MSTLIARVKFTQWAAREGIAAGVSGEILANGRFIRLTAASTVKLAKEMAAAGELIKFARHARTPANAVAELASRGMLALEIDDSVSSGGEQSTVAHVLRWTPDRATETQVAELSDLFATVRVAGAGIRTAPAPNAPGQAPDLAV